MGRGNLNFTTPFGDSDANGPQKHSSRSTKDPSDLSSLGVSRIETKAFKNDLLYA